MKHSGLQGQQAARQRNIAGYRAPLFLFLGAILSALSLGCGDFLGKHSGYEFDDLTQTMAPDPHAQETGGSDASPPATTNSDDQEMAANKGSVHPEEEEMEDPGPLIRQLLEKEAGGATGEIAEGADDYGPVLDVTPAHELWKLSLGQCLNLLKKKGISFTRPTFKTPGVDMPVVLTGPVDGVHIGPRWPQSKKKTKEVMDCRLALALQSLAQYGRTLGIEKVLYYTVYRPIKKLPPKCQTGKQSSRCRRLREAYHRAKKNPSWHLKALAVDIRWFVLKNGEWIDVLEHYDRRDGKPPCSYTAQTKQGRLLQDLACTLHRNHAFNVMLTPNANKDHHNHFHFDITPKAEWYIVR